MEFSHTPVLFSETIDNLKVRPDGIYVDGTLGGGGHSAGICARLGSGGMLIGIDRDDDALEAAEKRLRAYACRKELVHSNYTEVRRVLSDLGIEKIDGAVLDLGSARRRRERVFIYALGSSRYEDGQDCVVFSL